MHGAALSKYSIESRTNGHLMRHNYHWQSVGFYRKSITFHKCLEKTYNGRAGIIDNQWAPISQCSEILIPVRLFITGPQICAWWKRPVTPAPLEAEAGGGPKVQGLPGQLSKTLSQRKMWKGSQSAQICVYFTWMRSWVQSIILRITQQVTPWINKKWQVICDAH